MYETYIHIPVSIWRTIQTQLYSCQADKTLILVTIHLDMLINSEETAADLKIQEKNPAFSYDLFD